MTVGQALTIYAEQHAPTVAAPERIGYAIDALAPFWGSVKVAAVKGETCRRYAAWRGVAPGTARRELGTLQAALNHCAREGYLTSAPTVTLPAKPPAKQRWLTRTEAYWLLRAARRLRVDGRHLAWFLVLSLKTGTRKDRALSIEISAGPTLHHGRIDPVHGVLYRRGDGCLLGSAYGDWEYGLSDHCRMVLHRDGGVRLDLRQGRRFREDRPQPRWVVLHHGFAVADWRRHSDLEVDDSQMTDLRTALRRLNDAADEALAAAIKEDIAGMPFILRRLANQTDDLVDWGSVAQKAASHTARMVGETAPIVGDAPTPSFLLLPKQQEARPCDQ